ncbi:symmetrical bis(5'-nucleosyl)-tetraphosphatase [Robbsia sp. Bb-Pol-6]|uniref:bis(5'-nucleosyl)-tetraphosphatase (symmetrical) n=1 Tax=Robbsia betulipollinis TaxID=2981849 RepID=A0ABT3ZM12_9BURK|nr:symmetrical bis(5'-nucleosyl)-tetraphosphatase [Robbsia betulipollinis]MCY0387541.1 symmetrical bis(5'-nucleosyl)-tetraphosphatase [Robbsia betulipollinis]
MSPISPLSDAASSPVAIGDLQGCRDALDRLLEKIDRDVPASDGQGRAPAPLWFAGDLVNRGPDSLGTLRRLIGLGERVTAVLGNHDLHLLGVAAGARALKKNDTLSDILEAPDAEALLDWVRHRPLAHFADGMLMVHAGVLPQWDVDETLARAREVESGLRSDDWRAFVARLFGGDGTAWQADLTGDTRLRVIANALTRLRFCNADGVMEWKANGGLDSALPGFMPWFDVPGRRTADVTVVFGHWAALGLIRRDRLHGLDSGCVWGNALSAIRLTPDPGTRELFQVPCAKRPVPAPVALSHRSP